MYGTKEFYNSIKSEMAVLLATSAKDDVTMRVISPVFCGGDVLIFTSRNSVKYRQLTENPNCCISAGGVFAKAKASFLGSTMSDINKRLREIYCDKFPQAFDEGVENGGRDADFILFHITKITGWKTVDGNPTEPFETDM